MNPTPAIVFSDLDGTLLDHDDYGFAAALPALGALRDLAVPLILCTSKTLAEVIDISRDLDIRQPVIVENGGALCFPLDGAGYPFPLDAAERSGRHAVIRFSSPYTEIRTFIEAQRATHDYRLRGFGDMDDAQVAAETGLDLRRAGLARRRQCSEPFLWLDDDRRLRTFAAAARRLGLTVTRGGRFWHLMDDIGKGKAMQAMRALYAAGGADSAVTVALGDSENDRSMLQSAEIAVVVRRPDGSHLDCHGIRRTLFTDQPGPAGWNVAMLQVLEELGLREN